MHHIMILLLTFLISCNKSEESNKQESSGEIEKPMVSNISKDNNDCVDYVALWSATDISSKIGKNKKWVFLNYTVDLWSHPPSEKSGDVLGELRASSYARIIESSKNDYLVESPSTKVHGWINKSDVKSIVKKNIKTNKMCDND